MAVPQHPSPTLAPFSGGRRVPRLTKVGAATVLGGGRAAGTRRPFATHTHDVIVAGFAPGEHGAHLVVLVGMVLILVGVVADGVASARRHGRPEGSPRNAVR